MCLCDKENGYMCLECETLLRLDVKELIHHHKNEILAEGDWWYGLPNHSVNIYTQAEGEDFDSPDCVFHINVYDVGANGMDDYSAQWDLEPMTRQEIRLA